MTQLVGDDVVDLDEPHNVGNHPRFATRITSESERAMLASSPDPYVLLWTLFAAKEAAFKVAVKLADQVPVFAHAKFAVAADLASVRWRDLDLFLHIERGDGYVHAVVTTEAAVVESGVARIAPGDDPSRAARTLLGHEVVREAVPGSWDGFGPPRLASGLDVSLSHDGRFVSFALAVPSEADSARQG